MTANVRLKSRLNSSGGSVLGGLEEGHAIAINEVEAELEKGWSAVGGLEEGRSPPLNETQTEINLDKAEVACPYLQVLPNLHTLSRYVDSPFRYLIPKL